MFPRVAWIWAGLYLMGLTACTLPPLEGRTESSALTATSTSETRLGRGVSQMREQAQASPETTGVYALSDAQEAFAARALLARSAERSLDVQYYIWRDDSTGRLLLNELLQAADRGVRVRLLLDDGGTSGLDDALTSLDSHEQVEVRLFNPFSTRGSLKLTGYLTDFSRANRRMHNKSFTADNQASIVGGRNVGNEYFGASDGVLFADLDALVCGQVVDEISRDFDRYWASASAYPINRLLPGELGATLQAQRDAGAALLQSPQAQDYRAAVQRSPLVQHLMQAQLPLQWVPAQLVSDDPAKGLGLAKTDTLLGHQLTRVLGRPQQTVDVVSPYFVPTAAGVAAFAQLRKQGVRVRVLTNALEATDVAVVHSGYAKYRRELLSHGVELFEMRSQPQRSAAAEQDAKLRESAGRFGSSGSSLHAKTFAVDGQRVFVGSFNFDPRSQHLNTEMGLVLESPVLAQATHGLFDREVPENTYRVTLDEQQELRWHSGTGPTQVEFTREPNSTWWRRLSLWCLGLLPIEWLL